jgi:hypothetical protein
VRALEMRERHHRSKDPVKLEHLGNAIGLFAEERQVRQRIQAVKTDSTPVEAPKPVEGSALYQLLRAVVPPGEFAAIEKTEQDIGQGTRADRMEASVGVRSKRRTLRVEGSYSVTDRRVDFAVYGSLGCVKPRSSPRECRH